MPIPTRSPSVRVLDTHPDLTRPDAGLVVVSEFQLDGPADQRALFDASQAAWETLPWPRTLLSITWLAGTDGRSALAYVHWADDSEFAAFATTHRPFLAAHLAKAVPGLAPPPPTIYRRYRSGVRADAPTPGCIVAVSVQFDGPDDARQRAWIDTVFDAMAAEASPPAGGISGHFHASVDGTRVLNYAEWIDEASHVAALARSGTGSIGAGPKWREVQAFPGVASSRVARYRFERRLAPANDRT